MVVVVCFVMGVIRSPSFPSFASPRRFQSGIRRGGGRENLLIVQQESEKEPSDVLVVFVACAPCAFDSTPPSLPLQRGGTFLFPSFVRRA